MMEDKNLDILFNSLKGQFNTKLPNEGHQQRFIEKLNTNKDPFVLADKSSPPHWKTFLAIAASIIICFSMFATFQNQSKTIDLADVSPELSETQDFFTVTIASELKKLNKERSPLTESIINDALKQIQQLETDYQKLKNDLNNSGNDQRIIYAMISNFQNRIDILKTVLEQIEDVKQLKIITNDQKNTI